MKNTWAFLRRCKGDISLQLMAETPFEIRAHCQAVKICTGLIPHESQRKKPGKQAKSLLKGSLSNTMRFMESTPKSWLSVCGQSKPCVTTAYLKRRYLQQWALNHNGTRVGAL